MENSQPGAEQPSSTSGAGGSEGNRGKKGYVQKSGENSSRKKGPRFPRPPPQRRNDSTKLTLPKRGSGGQFSGRRGKRIHVRAPPNDELSKLRMLSAELQNAHSNVSGSVEQRVKRQFGTSPKLESNAFIDSSDVSDFHERLPDPVMKFPFELDPFQKRAILRIEQHDSIFVAAHTSAGKTVVAEYAIQLAADAGEKVIYTSPIKTLSNQKYRDFADKFEDVGLVTGDVSVNPEAQCTIMTTEILRSMLYRSSDVIQDVSFVIFDEVQYVNDEERGVVWEESIIMLPEHISIIMLSATVPNALEFASWVGRTKDRHVAVVATSKRPVPLCHSLLHRYIPGSPNLKTTVILRQGGRFLMKEYRNAMDEHEGASGVNKLDKNQEFSKTAVVSKDSGNGSRGGHGRGRGRGGRGGRGGKRERNDGNRWTNASAVAARTAAQATSSSGGMNKGASEWKPVVEYLRDNGLTPTILFCFSKKKCEAAVESLRNMDFLPANADKARVHSFFESSITRLEEEDRMIPQIQQVRENLKRGIAAHHSGLLPIIKEVTEMLFSTGLVRVLFATETFAMGVNMPARTVVFTGVRKNDGRRFRNLEPGEYTQMSGRAGRRGIDEIGNVFLYFASSERVLFESQLKEVMTGEPLTLKSAFRLTYNMILNVLRVDELRVEEMMKKSFSETAGEKNIESVNEILKRTRAKLEQSKTSGDPAKNEPAVADGITLASYAEAVHQIVASEASIQHAQVGRKSQKAYCNGRIVIVHNGDGVLSFGVIVSSAVNNRSSKGRGVAKGFTTVALIVGLTEKVIDFPNSILFAECLDGARGQTSGARDNSLCTDVGFKVKLFNVELKDIVYVSEVHERMSKSREKRQADIVKQWLSNGTVAELRDPLSAALNYLDSIVMDWTRTAKSNLAEGFPAPYKPLSLSVIGSSGRALGGQTFAVGTRDSSDDIPRSMDQESVEQHRDIIRSIVVSEDFANLLRAIPQSDRALSISKAYLRAKIDNQVRNLETYAEEGNIPTLLPEYQSRVKLLQKLQYVGEDGLSVQMKGRCACEVATVDSVILTELILENVLEGLDSCEVASLLSALVCRKKNSQENELDVVKSEGLFSAGYIESRMHMTRLVRRIGEAQEECGVSLEFDIGDDAVDYVDAMCHWELCEVVLKWAEGSSFASLTPLTQVQAGDIVVCIRRLGELLKDAQSVAKAVGYNELRDVLEGSIAAIRRDIVFCGSLYI